MFVILLDFIMGWYRIVLVLVLMNLLNYFFVELVLKVWFIINWFMIFLSLMVVREIVLKLWENDLNCILWICIKSISIVEENFGSFYYNCLN